MTECAQCGSCSVVCPVFRVTGREAHTARGRLHLRETAQLVPHSPLYEELFASCLLCGACAAVCPRGIDTRAAIIEARAGFSRVYGQGGFRKFLVRKALKHSGLMAGLGGLGRGAAGRIDSLLPKQSGLRLRLVLFDHDEEVQDSPAGGSLAAGSELSSLVYFPGCAAQTLWPEVVNSCGVLAQQCNFALTVPSGLSCCGLAAHSAGDTAEARALACRNIQALEECDGPILVSCASCYSHLAEYPGLFAGNAHWQKRAERVVDRLRELTTFLAQFQNFKPIAQSVQRPRRRVFYHDPCHFRYQTLITMPPRDLLRRCSGLELVEPEDGPGCCGMGGLFHLGEPELSARIHDRLLATVLPLRPQVITSTCSGCLMQWRMAVAESGLDIRVVHLARLLAEESGAGEFPGDGPICGG
ncbi:MAG: (Fe-S)-binding protein [Desulfobulbaceae bacterium]|uniref:Glycolate oxidase iron-sulfur subunit n=1 Tax=Candidatus Desulfatifera sulfidica TaxID=2841691 RepID=A0A8J6NA86_9BACT|nr:(Fe-S)-binding protein [Candidatus Desulfatifera sulfidica]